jgi:ABC-2 type transport system ATP-binding protein
MRQRVGLAQALLHDPDVLILDEPTIGLDPAQIREVRSLISELGKRHTILLSTHILSEVEQLCSRVIMIIEGRIWADLPIAEVASAAGAAGQVTVTVARPTVQTSKLLALVPGVHQVQLAVTGELSMATDGRDETRAAIAEAVVREGWGLLSMTTGRMDLESLFLSKLRQATEQSPAEVDPRVGAAGRGAPDLMGERSEVGR